MWLKSYSKTLLETTMNVTLSVKFIQLCQSSKRLALNTDLAVLSRMSCSRKRFPRWISEYSVC